jgi:hypothetical protein
MLPSFATDSVTVITPVMVDDRGKQVPDWSQAPAATVVVAGCSVQPGASAEDLVGRDAVTIRWTVWAPPGTQITAYDHVQVGARVFAVDGEPAVWRSPTGAVSHVQFLLIDWEG